MEVIIDLITKYGWHAVVIAIATFALVECIKPLARKFIQKENLRHVFYILCTYAFAFGLTYAVAAIVKRVEDALSLYGSAMLVINVLCPIITNIGFFEWVESILGELWDKVSENSAWKKAVTELGNSFGVDSDILDRICTKIEEEYMPLIKEGAEAFFSGNKEELVLNIKQKLAGFVDDDILQDLAESLYSKLADSWKN